MEGVPQLNEIQKNSSVHYLLINVLEINEK